MDTLARLVMRLLLVPLGIAVGLMVAMTVLFSAHWNSIESLAHADPDARGTGLIAFLILGPLLAIVLTLAVATSALVAGIGVLIAEAFAIRSWIYHAANGGLAAWISWSMLQSPQDEYLFLVEPKVWVAAGLAGGLAYWVIAGWTAGFWKPVFAPKVPKPPNPPALPPGETPASIISAPAMPAQTVPAQTPTQI